MSRPETQLFSSLQGKRFSLRALAASVSLHCAILTLLICLPLSLVPEVRYTIVEIIPPLMLPQLARRSPARPQPTVIRAPLRFSDPIAPVPLAEPKEAKKPEEPPAASKILDTAPRAPEITPLPIPLQALTPPPVVSTPVAKLGGFTDSIPAERPARKPRELEASGFGAPDDTSRQKGRKDGATVQGIFDATAEAGAGSGGARRSREIIAGTGFGDNVANAANGLRSAGDSRGLVREGEFGDARPAANAFQPRPQPARPALLAAEIISKPKPAYTKEARDLGLEGEVVLEILFTASGDIRILRLIRGLGHGLDEAAVRAAEQIRFKPAERDGKPIDSRSVVQIIFRLT